jgi:hypothetical protein
MATFLDETVDKDILTEEVSDVNELDNDISQVEENVQEAPEQSSQQDDDDVPEKYRGKTPKEIARMHMEAEKALGRQGSEVGELRRLVDDFIKSQAVNKQTQQQAPEDDVDEVDFFADPNSAINKAIAKHPKVKAAEELTLNMKKAEALATLKAEHPDFTNIIQTQEFADWIGKSKVRQELYVRADQAFDFDAANELLTTWKERQSVVERTKEVEKIERKQAVKAASTGSAKGSGETSKKTYRRADIIDLMVRDPDRYQTLEPEIMKAYSEGRVK